MAKSKDNKPQLNRMEETEIEKKQNGNQNQSQCPLPNGALLIIGGKESKENGSEPENKETPENFIAQEILKKFVELTGKEKPVIEVITTASSQGDEAFKDYQKVFAELGVSDIGHIHHKTRAEVLEDNLEERVAAVDGLFFSGGDQLLLASLYGGTTFLKALKDRYINDKIVIAGTSAGAMAMSTPMIYAGSKEVEELGGEIKVTTGLEFLKDVCIDTHFVHRGRFIRLAQVIASNPTCIGIGIEEDTAILVTNGVYAEVLGSGTIIIIDGYNISQTNVADFGSKRPISIRDLRVHILSSGDKYQIEVLNPPHQ
jgi:cyanophycinase